MSSSSMRREVLNSFKCIHRARCYVFQGDSQALECARQQINESYKSNKSETDEEKIKDLIKFAFDVIHELKSSVVQLKQTQPGIYQAQLRPEMFEEQSTVKENKLSKD